MTVSEFLRNEILKGNMNDSTLLTVKYKRKNYLATIQECTKNFGMLLVKQCEKKAELNGDDMKNSFILKVV